MAGIICPLHLVEAWRRRPLIWASLTAEEASSDTNALFNGKDLRDWDGDPAVWSVQRGVILGSSDGRPLRENSFLVSRRKYGDFELRFEVKLRNGNSGLQFRSERFGDWGVRGYQVDFATGKGWGNLHGEGLPGGLILDGWQDKAEFAVRSEWNRISLRCEGNRIRVWVNGVVVNDVLDPGATLGVLALQLHRGEAMQVEFRNIRIVEDPARIDPGLYPGPNRFRVSVHRRAGLSQPPTSGSGLEQPASHLDQRGIKRSQPHVLSASPLCSHSGSNSQSTTRQHDHRPRTRVSLWTAAAGSLVDKAIQGVRSHPCRQGLPALATDRSRSQVVEPSFSKVVHNERSSHSVI